MSQLTDMILNGAGNGKHRGMILANLQRAFDTLNHKTLLDSMKYISFSDKTIKWFHSYLTYRAFFVSLGTVFLESGIIRFGAPQGSILAPLLFFLYINDIFQALSNTHTYMWANDTIVLVNIKQNSFFSVGIRIYPNLK